MRVQFSIGAAGLIVFQLTAQQNQGWHFRKDDPATKKHVIQIDAASFESTALGQALTLHDVTVRVYDASGSFTQLQSNDAIINVKRGTLTYGPQLRAVLKLKNRS